MQNAYVQRMVTHQISLSTLADSISLPLTLLFATSFTTGTVPAIWRTATVTPVFKKRHFQ